jgi:hypothetical protein
MAGHTKGPWIREGATVYSLYCPLGLWDDAGKPMPVNRFLLNVEHRQGGNSRTGERYGCPQDEAEANALLIAAAPDLLAALEWMHKTCVERGDNKHWDYMRSAHAALQLAKHGASVAGAAPATTNEEAV